MKLIKIVGHPAAVMSMFLLLLISGEHFGGFYLLYLLMGLPFGALHFIIALVGLTAVFLGYIIYRKQLHIVKPLLYITGKILLIQALFVFFKYSDGYNDSTFHQFIPLISFVLFGCCVLCNLIVAFLLLIKIWGKDNEPLKIASQ